MNTTYAAFAAELDAILRKYYGVKHAAVISTAYGRVKAERQTAELGNLCDWDRDTMIDHCMDGPSQWLGRKVFEQSYDDGSMRQMAEWYERFAIERPWIK